MAPARGRPVGTTKTEKEKLDARNQRATKKAQQRKQSVFMDEWMSNESTSNVDRAPGDVSLPPETRVDRVEYDGDIFYDSLMEPTSSIGDQHESNMEYNEEEEDSMEEIPNKATAIGSYLGKVMEILKDELSKKTRGGVMISHWLLDIASQHDYWIPACMAKKVCSTASIPHHDDAYYRDIFLWLPDHRWGSFPCPNGCGKDVSTHGLATTTRCVHTLDGHYFIITRRYICYECKKIKEKNENDDREYSWTGTNQRILEGLPYNRGSYFPAFLTKKSGLDMQIVDLMRALFCNGIRPSQMADIMHELSTKRHARKWLQRENQLAADKKLLGMTADLFGTYGDSATYDGRVCTGRYLSHAFKLFQHSVKDHMLREVKKRSAEVIRWDVSYKEAKQLCRFRGGRVFRGLVTATNELGEVRMQFHVVTDGHDQMSGALGELKETLKSYGFQMPQVVYTDKPAEDAAFFKTHLPSVANTEARLNSSTPEVVMKQVDEKSGPKTCHLDPSEYILISKKTEIAEAVALLRAHLNSMQPHDRIIGLDEEHEYGSKAKYPPNGRDKVSLIQIAYQVHPGKRRSLLLHVRQHDKLPDELMELFRDQSILFVGKRIEGDLRNIGDDFGIRAITDLSRFCDIAHMAKARGVIQDARTGLKELVRVVLDETMKKDDDIRSSQWSTTSLSIEQLEYAALDAIKSHEVYEKLQAYPDYASRLSMTSAKIGAEVDIIPGTGSQRANNGLPFPVAAVGVIVHDDDWTPPQGISVKGDAGASTLASDPTVIVQVKSITGPFLIVPGFKKSVNKPTRRNKGSVAVTLRDFQAAATSEPMRVRLPLAMLKLHNPNKDLSQSLSSEPNQDGIDNLDNNEAYVAPRWQISIKENQSNSSNAADDSDQQDASHEEMEARKEMTGEEMALVAYLQKIANETDRSTENAKLPPVPLEISDTFRSVLGDPWHYMDRVKVPVKHSLRKAFFVALAEAFFHWEPTAMACAKAALKKEGKTDEQIEAMLYYDTAFFTECVPRVVLPPSQLYWRVRNVYATFGPKLCDGKPLFNERAWKKAGNVLNEIAKGYASDPPGFSMYARKIDARGHEKSNYLGLPVYWCLRGTGLTESHHKQFLQSVGIWATGIEMADAVRQEHRHRYNHHMAERRRAGFPMLGHVDTWLIDAIQIICLENHNVLVYPNWVNTNDYASTSESCGVIPLQPSSLTDLVNSLELPGAPILTREQSYLALHQNVKLPFTPITTKDEAKVFRTLALENTALLKDMDKMAQEWISRVNGHTVMPKLPVYLRTYRDKFLRHQRMEDAVSNMSDAIAKLREDNNEGHPRGITDSHSTSNESINNAATNDTNENCDSDETLSIVPTPGGEADMEDSSNDSSSEKQDTQTASSNKEESSTRLIVGKQCTTAKNPLAVQDEPILVCKDVSTEVHGSVGESVENQGMTDLPAQKDKEDSRLVNQHRIMPRVSVGQMILTQWSLLQGTPGMFNRPTRADLQSRNHNRVVAGTIISNHRNDTQPRESRKRPPRGPDNKPRKVRRCACCDRSDCKGRHPRYGREHCENKHIATV